MKKETIYDENKYPIFEIEIDDPGKYRAVSMRAKVYEVVSWEADDSKTTYERELYLSCYIKWDSCSHFYFGEEDADGNQDGYLHLCGVESFKKHTMLLEKLYELAFKEMGRSPLEGEEYATSNSVRS